MNLSPLAPHITLDWLQCLIWYKKFLWFIISPRNTMPVCRHTGVQVAARFILDVSSGVCKCQVMTVREKSQGCGVWKCQQRQGSCNACNGVLGDMWWLLVPPPDGEERGQHKTNSSSADCHFVIICNWWPFSPPRHHSSWPCYSPSLSTLDNGVNTNGETSVTVCTRVVNISCRVCIKIPGNWPCISPLFCSTHYT